MKRKQRGFSLPELLIVVAIVGLISLVGVPAFITYFNSARVNSAMRSFTTDMRGARQRAVARSRAVKISFEEGANQRIYRIYDGNADLTAWTQLGADRMLPEYVYIHETTLEDGDVAPDDWADLVYRPNGTAAALNGSGLDPLPTETEGGKEVTKLVIRTDTEVPYNQFTLYLDTSGRVSTTRSKF